MLTGGTWSLIVRPKPPGRTQPASVAVEKTPPAIPHIRYNLFLNVIIYYVNAQFMQYQNLTSVTKLS